MPPSAQSLEIPPESASRERELQTSLQVVVSRDLGDPPRNLTTASRLRASARHRPPHPSGAAASLLGTSRRRTHPAPPRLRPGRRGGAVRPGLPAPRCRVDDGRASPSMARTPSCLLQTTSPWHSESNEEDARGLSDRPSTRWRCTAPRRDEGYPLLRRAHRRPPATSPANCSRTTITALLAASTLPPGDSSSIRPSRCSACSREPAPSACARRRSNSPELTCVSPGGDCRRR